MKKIVSGVSCAICFLFMLSLTACSSKQNVIKGKYIADFDDSIYYIFYEDNTYETNYDWDLSVDSSKGLYTISEGNITLYNENGDYTYEIGCVYKDYIGSWWRGILPEAYDDVTITTELGDLILEYNIKEDKTYEYIVTSDGQVVHTENGMYLINNDKVICTSESDETHTFINADNRTYCIDYVKD